MLDDRITRFVHENMQVASRELDEQLQEELTRIDSEFIRAGQLGSSGHGASYARACRRTLRGRGQYLFIEIQRALGLYPQVFDAETKSFLLGLHITEVRGQCTALQRMVEALLGSRVGKSSWGAICSQLNSECDHLQEKYKLQLEAFVEAALQRGKAAPEGDARVVINGTVGVVQTGAYATSTITLNVGTDDREAMLKALDFVAATLRDSRQLAEEHQRQMLEIVAQAKVAAQEPRANSSLLKGLFTVLCETLQTLAATEPAMAALRVAALPFGIAL